MDAPQSVSLTAGDRVKVLVSTEKRDPWLTPKQGWEGIAVAPATNMESTHWQIRFVEPWCSLGMTRIMPLSSLQVIPGGEQDVLPEEPGEQGDMSPDEALDEAVEFAVTDEIEDAACEDFPTEEEGELTTLGPDETPDPAPEPKRAAKGGSREFLVGTQFRVKDQAGDSSGEEHIVRRRGQIGTVTRTCELATSCVEVSFGDGGLPVTVPKSYLAPVKLAQDGNPNDQRKIKAKSQMKLPF